MKNLAEAGTPGNISPNPRLSEPQNEIADGPIAAPDCATGYPILQPPEADPNPGDLPPDFKDTTQAANNAKARGFNLAPADSANSAAKIEAITDDLIVVALCDGHESPEFKGKLQYLWEQKTAALVSSLHRRVLFFFQRPPGAPNVEGELIAGVYVLTEKYVTLESGSPTDGCHWINRYVIAPAPAWLLEQLDRLAASAASPLQTEEGNDTVSADVDGEMIHIPSNTPPLAISQAPVVEEWTGPADEEEDNEDEVPDAHDAFRDADATDAASMADPEPEQEARTPVEVWQPATKLESALDYARRGFRVFPIAPDDKKPPLIKRWDIHASADEARIRQWWDWWPDANIGVPMDNMAAVDIDVRRVLQEVADEFTEKHLPSENRSLTVTTWSGGKHIIYSLPHGLNLSNQIDAFAKGIDLKTGSNGYLVGVGSTIDGKAYEWANQRPIKELTPGLIQLLDDRKKLKTAQKSADAVKRLVEEDDWAIQTATEYIEDHAPEAHEGHGGDTTTFSVAAQLFDFGVSKSTALDLMHRYNEIKCSPPWNADALAQKVDSAMRNRQNPIGNEHHLVKCRVFNPEEIDESKKPMPRSEADASAASAVAPPGWDEPTDFWAGESEPPDLPAGVVPEIVERFARDRARRLGVEAGAPAACLITALASAISAHQRLQMRQKDPQWTVKAILWTAIVAKSGSNKSATLENAMAPVAALEHRWLQDYAHAKRAWDAEQKAKQEAKKEAKQEAKKAAEARGAKSASESHANPHDGESR